MQVRNARAGDAHEVLALWDAAGVVPSPTDDADAIGTVIGAGSLLVAENGEGTLVGTLIAGFDGWRGCLYRLAVLPGYRRQGVASLLTSSAEQRLSAAGCRRLSVLVVGSDLRATAFWAAAGYDVDAKITRYVKTYPPASG